MRLFWFLTAAAVAALVASTVSFAAPVSQKHEWSKMSLAMREVAQRKTIINDWRIYTTWKASRWIVIGPGIDRARPVVKLAVPLPPGVAARLDDMKVVQRDLRRTAKALRQKRRRETMRPLAPSGSSDSALLCIHSHEGSWTDPNPPYYGGMQEDLTFQKEYGPEFLARWGTADQWPPWAQLVSAERARDGWYNPVLRTRFSARGYGPWPSTRIMCGV